MKVTINEPVITPPPPTTVTLELSLEKVRLLRHFADPAGVRLFAAAERFLNKTAHITVGDWAPSRCFKD